MTVSIVLECYHDIINCIVMLFLCMLNDSLNPLNSIMPQSYGAEESERKILTVCSKET